MKAITAMCQDGIRTIRIADISIVYLLIDKNEEEERRFIVGIITKCAIECVLARKKCFDDAKAIHERILHLTNCETETVNAEDIDTLEILSMNREVEQLI